MPRTVYIHGMTSNGDDSVDLLAKQVQLVGGVGEHIPLTYDYISTRDAYAGLRYGTRSHKPSELALEIGQKIFNQTKDGDNAIGHSLGAIALWASMWLGRQYDNVFLFAGALDEERLWPSVGFHKLYNIFCMDDRILHVADGLVLSDFGALGKYGYKGGFDPRIENIQAWPMTPIVDEWIHSFYFQQPDLTKWAEFVRDKING